jgi:hypothetical protein
MPTMLGIAVVSASVLLIQQATPDTPAPDDPAGLTADEPTIDEPAIDEPGIDDPAIDKPAIDKPPISGQAVIDRYIAVTGGLEAWQALHSIRGIGTWEMPGLPFTGRLIIDQTADAYRMSVDMFQIDALGKAEHKIRQLTVRNGKQTWRVQGDAPAQLLKGKEHADLLRKDSFNPLLHAASRYASMTMDGMEDIDGRPCWKVSLVPIDPDAALEIRWFDVAEGLQRKIAETPRAGGVTDEVFLEVYRPVGAVTLNHVTRVSRLGRVVVRTFDAMQTNVTIDPCLFELPAGLAPEVETTPTEE